MADDNTLRSYRSNDPYRRSEQQAAAPVDDPLAELVRLIGQPDPFTDNPPRYPQSGAPRAPQTARRDQSDEPGDWRRHVQRPNFETREEPRFDSDQRYGAADPYGAASEPAPPPFGTDHDPYRIASRQSDPRYADPRYDDPRYADPRYSDARADYAQESHPQESHPLASHPQASYAVPSVYSDEPMFDADRRYGEASKGRRHAGVETRSDEDYDDPPRRKRGNSLVTAAVLIGCAMLGTAGAYSYRTYMSTSGSKQAPVIIADTSPSKVVPAERKSARPQDRVGGQGGDEQLVSREEQPVTLRAPGAGAVPRVVFPSPMESAPEAAPQAPSSTGSTPPPRASNAQATDQPKRVRTVTIRPEGDAGAPPPAARSAASPVAPRASRDEPLSLLDPAAPASAPRPQARGREAVPSEPRLASIPPSSGGYMVQVSSQRSESDAQASFKALQDKYSQLRSRQLVVQRADLGTRGIYYRAMVGPFGTSEEANSLCSSLKQSGGQCIIQRN